MSHSAEVTMVSDQEIYLRGEAINVHDIKSIMVDAECRIQGISLYSDEHIKDPSSS